MIGLSYRRIKRSDFSLFDNEGTPGVDLSTEYVTGGKSKRADSAKGKNRAVFRAKAIAQNKRGASAQPKFGKRKGAKKP